MLEIQSPAFSMRHIDRHFPYEGIELTTQQSESGEFAGHCRERQ
jgi:hypothetical protein